MPQIIVLVSLVCSSFDYLDKTFALARVVRCKLQNRLIILYTRPLWPFMQCYLSKPMNESVDYKGVALHESLCKVAGDQHESGASLHMRPKCDERMDASYVSVIGPSRIRYPLLPINRLQPL
ncbi:hypothetical protein VNO77_23062 [Canavalia gladiata]|uniref:Uncharacterized protein n=1 Tax=Canavalia gladiata TaxID=3824 RepID=A0AAN9Q8K5_CANGL